MSRNMPPRGTKVDLNVFPEDGEWSVEVVSVDPALHKLYGNPLLLDWSCDDADEARMSGELFAKSHGYEVTKVRYYDAAGKRVEEAKT